MITTSLYTDITPSGERRGPAVAADLWVVQRVEQVVATLSPQQTQTASHWHTAVSLLATHSQLWRYRHLSLYNGNSWSLKLGAERGKNGSDRHRAEVHGLRSGGAQADWRGWLHQYANRSDWEVMEPCQKPETHVNNCKTIKSSCWVSLRTHRFHFFSRKTVL